MSATFTVETRGVRRAEPVWGTVISVDIRDAVGHELVDELFSWFDRVDALFSTWRPDSEISRLARCDLHRSDVSGEVHEVLDLCDTILEVSRGAFDITFASDPRVRPRPGFGPIDPSGVVKGWALERAAARLAGEGIENFSINAGGDVLTRGTPGHDRQWRVGIQHPTERHAVAAVVGGFDLAVATSGRYERGDHVIDPRTGAPATDLLSITVVGPDLALADGYATAALVLGEEGMQWLTTLPGVEALAVTGEACVVRTDAFPLASPPHP